MFQSKVLWSFVVFCGISSFLFGWRRFVDDTTTPTMMFTVMGDRRNVVSYYILWVDRPGLRLCDLWYHRYRKDMKDQFTVTVSIMR